MKCSSWVLFFLFMGLRSYSQTQTCPVNINFATGDLTHWYAYTGNNRDGNGAGAIKAKFDSTTTAPGGTIGRKSIQEYQLNSVTGIQVITTQGTDAFGGFPKIPTINGYNYRYSILLGSTAVSRGSNNGSAAGGYIRGVQYRIRVPAGPATEPYTMTYAYAMVLENGTHVSSQQPLMSATLRTSAGVIECASPSYYLPTLGNVSEGGRGATLDSATAIRNGFHVSSNDSPNMDFDPFSGQGYYLQDVWYKGWTEVTFDLSPYRGQDVSLTLEADNCVPGGHFAYGYIAIRNNCAGLEISGDSLVCNNSNIMYSVPALAGATYNWSIPSDWTLISSDTSSIIQIRTSRNGGKVAVREKNSCADLSDTIDIKTLPSPEGGELLGATTVCAGENSSKLNLFDYSGVITKWLASTDSANWTVIPNIDSNYIAANLDTTTLYRVVVGKGDVCPPDTSSAARIAVDQKTVGGLLDPAQSSLCIGQTAGQLLTLSGNRGVVQNWQYSTDGTNWSDFSPVVGSSQTAVSNITTTTQFRVIDKNGVCPIDSSAVASIEFVPVQYPEAAISPADTTICYGAKASLAVDVGTGTSYTWLPGSSGGNINGVPYSFVNEVSPPITTDYILSVLNAGCPNPLLDTFHVRVLAPVIVDAGRDTSVVVGQPLQLSAVSNDPGPDSFIWEPATGLDNPQIANPVGLYTGFDNIIKYLVTATTPAGCTGTAALTVKVFKTKPDIFVPNAFTPGSAYNAVFRPIPVGINILNYFRIYNRVGQLVFSTTTMGKGWDGTVNGVPQASGGYVWTVQGVDYLGDTIIKKGTMVLIR